MSNPTGYRVVTTERMTGGFEQTVSIFPPVNEPSISRKAATDRLDAVLIGCDHMRRKFGLLPGEDTLTAQLLPTGRARMKVVTDEQARKAYALMHELIGA